MAFRALGLFFSVEQSLELVIALLTDVLVNRHGRLRYLLESICGEFANIKTGPGELFGVWPENTNKMGSSHTVSRAAVAQRRPHPDNSELSSAAPNSSAACTGAPD